MTVVGQVKMRKVISTMVLRMSLVKDFGEFNVAIFVLLSQNHDAFLCTLMLWFFLETFTTLIIYLKGSST